MSQEFKFDVAGNPNILLYSPSTHTSANNPPEAKIFSSYIIIEATVRKDGSDLSTKIGNIYDDEVNKINSCLENQKKDIELFITQKQNLIEQIYNDLVSKTKENEDYNNSINDKIFNK